MFSDSHGVTNITQDDDSFSQTSDANSSQYGGFRAEPAGNDGPASETLDDSCIAYDVLCMGAFDKGSNLSDPSDDTVATFSSRGPTIGGRKKPDLVAVGIAAYANRRWATQSALWAGSLSGTSFAAPQGAGAAALLAGSGITDPLAEKAILIDSARPGRVTPASPMGTQTTWQPDWGWGEVDLNAALGQRTSFATGTVPGYGVRFYAANVSAGDRATLVWNRRGNLCRDWGCQPNVLTLSNLDLQQVDANTGAFQAQSNSAIDNVEQVRSPGAGQTIYKVRATSNVDGLTGEPFALAASRPVTPLENPQPTVTLSMPNTRLTPGQTATVTAIAHNPSSDLTAENASLALTMPAGMQIVSGAQTQSLGTLDAEGGAGDTAAATWTVKATGDVTGNVVATATASRYGETFSGGASSQVVVDGTPPSPTVVVPSHGGSAGIDVTWSAADSGVGVDHYDVEVSADGGPFIPWLTATTALVASYPGIAGHTYTFRVRAADRIGNLSPYAVSSPVPIVLPTSGTGPPAGAGAPPSTGGTGSGAPRLPSPALRLRTVRRTSATLVVNGTLLRRASARVDVVYTVTIGRKRYRVRARVRRSAGRFRATVRIPAAARGARRGTLRISYRGDRSFRAETVRLSVRSG